MRTSLRRLSKEADRLLAGGGLVLAAFLTFLLWAGGYNPAYFVAVGFLAVACVAYLALRDRMPTDAKTTTKPRWWLDIAFGVVFGASVLVYLFRPEEYVRPLAYFVLLAVAAGILAAKAWRLPPGRTQTVITLAEIVAVGLSAVWSVSFLYPTLIGLDPWNHMEKTLVVLGGDVHWRQLPFMYLITAGVMKVTGAGYREAVMAVMPPLLVVGNATFIYLIGKMVWNRRAGLLAALVVSVAGWVVFFSFWTIPNALGLTLSLAVAWIVLRWLMVGMRWWAFAGSVTVLMTILIFTHAIATLWALMFIGTFWLFSLRSGHGRRLLTVLVVMVIMVGVWWQWLGYNWRLTDFVLGGFSATRYELTKPVGSNGEAVFFENGLVPPEDEWQIQTVVDDTTQPVVGDTTQPVVDDTTQPVVQNAVQPSWETLGGAPVTEMVFNSLGMFLICGLGILGALRMLRHGEGRYAGGWVALGVLALAAGFLPMFVGASFLEHRWWLLAEVVLGIPVAVALFGIIPRRGGAAVVGVVLAVLTGLNLLGMPTNMDQRAVSANLLPRYALTQAEVDGLQAVLDGWDGTVGIDSMYGQVSHLLAVADRERLRNLTPNLLAGTPARGRCDLVIIRNEVIDGVLAWGDGTMHRLNYDPRVRLVAAGYEVVYENEDITGLWKWLDNHESRE